MVWFVGTGASSKRRKVDEDAAPVVVLAPSGDPNDQAALLEEKVVMPELKGIPKLLMELQAEDINQVLEALAGLYTLLDGGNDQEQERKKAINLGAPTLLVLTLREYPIHGKIQALCCNCLAPLCYESKIARSAFLEMGGVEAVVSAARIFSKSAPDGAFCVLMNAFSGEMDDEKEATLQVSKRFVEEWNGLGLVQEAMKNFPDHASLQGSCCGLLCNLSNQQIFHEAIVESGIIVAVGAALQNHLKNEKVRVGANEFMKQMCVEGARTEKVGKD